MSEDDMDFSWEASSGSSEEQPSTPVDINVSDLVKKMRDHRKGVQIKKRTFKLKTYYDCFVGKEAVDWLVRELKLQDRQEAVAVGEMLMFRGIIQHVTNTEPFVDGYFFYRFTQDERKAHKKELAKKVSPFLYHIPTLFFNEQEIAGLADKMCNPKEGIEIKDRKYRLKKYQMCFVGSDAVDWMVKSLGFKNRADAVALGRILFERGVFHHVCDDHNFEDKFYFYRFYKHEKKHEKQGIESAKLSHRFASSSSLVPASGSSIFDLIKMDVSDSIMEEQERKIMFLKVRLYEDIKKRGTISSEEISWLISVVESDIESDEVKTAAASTLARFAFPEEFTSNIRNQLIKDSIFHTLLLYASKGLIKVHQEIPKEDVELVRKLGAGASGVVYVGKWKNKEVAVKVFNEDSLGFSIDDFHRELAFMSMLKHENLVKCYGACTQGPDYFILMELMQGGDLHSFLRNETIEWDRQLIIDMAIAIVKPTMYLHEVDIIHRDLKSMNYLIGEDIDCLKLTDFGISRAIEPGGVAPAEGTPAFLPPEVFKSQKVSESADVYSFAMVLWELITRQDPWNGVAPWEIPDLVMSGKRPEIPVSCSPDFAMLIKNCWHQDPSKRPSFKQIFAYLMKLKNACLGKVCLRKLSSLIQVKH